MRSRITERNIFPQFNMVAEYNKLHSLFNGRAVFGKQALATRMVVPTLSYMDCLRLFFLDWDLRGSFTSVEEMVAAFQIRQFDFNSSFTEERLLDYIQFVLNAVIFVNEKLNEHPNGLYSSGVTIFNAIVDNSRYIVEKLGAELIPEDKEIFVAYKDDVATAIKIMNPDLEASIVEYLKTDTRGDLQRKGEIICTLAKKLEPYERTLKGTEFKSLCDDTTFLMNTIGARHYCNPKNKIEAKFEEMPVEEKEKWYDNTFQMILACMSALPYIDFKKEICEVKQ